MSLTIEQSFNAYRSRQKVFEDSPGNLAIKLKSARKRAEVLVGETDHASSANGKRVNDRQESSD
jgi:hypothetical protein